jgi:hypothetical protein
MSNLSAFYGAALGQSPAQGQTNVLPDTDSPVVTLTRLYPYQSYFDTALLEKALQQQNPQDPIATLTKEDLQLTGYGIGLHPSSETPVAVQLRTGGKSSTSSPLVLKPGMVYFPSGTEKGYAFSGFTFGLPFGWLGGGMATLCIYQMPSSTSAYDTNSEVIFHRTRMRVYQPAQLVAPPAGAGQISQAPYNWPLRFPWTQALRGANSISQRGQSTFSVVKPSKVIMALRGVSTLAAPATMRLIFQATDDFSRDVNNAVTLTNPVYIDVTWPAFNSVGAGGNLAVQNPTILLTDTNNATASAAVRLAANDGGVVCVDTSGGALAGCHVDFVRYGQL